MKVLLLPVPEIDYTVPHDEIKRALVALGISRHYLGFPVVVNNTLPPTEIRLRNTDGKKYGIVNIKA